MHYFNVFFQKLRIVNAGREYEADVTHLHHDGWHELNVNERKPGEREQR
jgi:hypothetical protein